MRIAFAGKGGSGKSAIAGTLARCLAADGEAVLVIDSDPMPGLAWAMGLDPSDEGLPDDLVVEGGEGGPRFRLREDLPPEDVVEAHARRGPDGVRLLQFGKFHDNGRRFARSQHAFSEITRRIDDRRWHIVGDLPAGTRQPFFGWARYADTLVVVVEPTVKSIRTARRLAKMGNPADRREGAHVPTVVAVANKVRAPNDEALIRDATGLEVVAAVPHDPSLAAAERAGRAPYDATPDGPAVTVLRSLSGRLLGRPAGNASAGNASERTA